MTVAYNKVIVGGTLPNGEVWTVNPCFASFPGGNLITTFADLQTWANSINTAMATSWLGSFLASLVSGQGPVTSITCQYYDANNILTQQAVAAVSANGLGNGTMTKTFQSAVVVSLRTGRPGRSYRGRLYFPALGATISTTSGRLNVPAASGVAAAANTFLKSIENATPGTFALDLAVVSQTMSTATPVNQLQVGDIIDTQRRRRDKEVEAYGIVTY